MANPHQRARRVPRVEVRARLLQAAGEVFTKRGYNGASLDEVAQAAGFSKGAVYSNFLNKEDLFLALVTDRVQARLRAIELEVDRTDRHGKRGAEEAGRAMAALLKQDPQWHVLFLEFWLFAMRHSDAHRRLAEHRKLVRASVEGLLERERISRGLKLSIPSRRLAAILLALSNGLAIEHLIDPDAISPSLFLDATKLLLR